MASLPTHQPDVKITVPMEFCLTIDNATAERINSGEISKADLSQEISYKLNSVIRSVLASLTSPEFKDRIVSACWAKIHAPK